MAFLKRILLALSVGYVLFFFGERVFWSFTRGAALAPDEPDSLGIYLATWAVYSLFAYMMLVVIEYFKVRSIWALFLAGSIFGWIVEGIYAMTFFGGAGIPLPFSIIWTAVAWHALISVMAGLYYLRTSLSDKSFIHAALTSSALGLFWGIWALAWVLETPPLLVHPLEFLAHAFISTLFFAIAQWTMTVSHPASFTSTRTERIVLLVIAIAFTAFVTTPAVWFAILILLACFAVAFFALWRNKKKETGEHILGSLGRRITPSKYLALFCMPVVATLIYGGGNTLGLAFPSNIATLFISCFLGSVFLVLSLIKVFRMK